MPNMSFQHRASSLILKYLQQELNDAEQLELTAWIEAAPEHKVLFEELVTGDGIREELNSLYRLRKELDKKIYREIPEARKVIPLYKRSFFRIAAAVAFFTILGSAGYYLVNRNNHTRFVITASDPQEKRFKNDIDPGKYKAILMLAGGQKVILDSAGGIIASQDNVKIRNDAGLLNYESVEIGSSTEVSYNTLTTAKGETYPVKLSDGTMVWLNSGSSLHFPTVFTGNDRKVEITGEAYFEVAKDTTRPFRIKKPGDSFETEVLGTHFNINAYDDEAAVKVTLLEGIVKVKEGNSSTLLRPGQQAQVSVPMGNKERTISVLTDINIDQVIAWKNGLFDFRNADIREIMRQIARWYDIDVVYQGNPSGERFKGKVSRDAKLTELLKILELNDVRFIIDGKKITVMQ